MARDAGAGLGLAGLQIPGSGGNGEQPRHRDQKEERQEYFFHRVHALLRLKRKWTGLSPGHGPDFRKSRLFALIADPVDRAGLVIRHKDRSVDVLLHVNRTSEIDAVFIHPAFGERFRFCGVLPAVQTR